MGFSALTQLHYLFPKSYCVVTKILKEYRKATHFGLHCLRIEDRDSDKRLEQLHVLKEYAIKENLKTPYKNA